MMDDQLEKLYHKYWEMHSELMASGSNPIEIAGILTAHALIIYKTILQLTLLQVTCRFLSAVRQALIVN